MGGPPFPSSPKGEKKVVYLIGEEKKKEGPPLSRIKNEKNGKTGGGCIWYLRPNYK